MRAPISPAISVVSMAGSMRRWMANSHSSCLRSASTADCMSGYCSLQASGAPSMGGRPMDLAERGGGGRMVLEAREPALPVGAELGHHAALDEGPAHRRCIALQLGEFLGIFGRQGVGDGRHQLGDLHDRSLQAAERGGEFHRAAGAIMARRPSAGSRRSARRPRRHWRRPAHSGRHGPRSGSFRDRTTRTSRRASVRIPMCALGATLEPWPACFRRLLSGAARHHGQSIGKSPELKGRITPWANCPESSARGCPRSPRRRRGRG